MIIRSTAFSEKIAVITEVGSDIVPSPSQNLMAETPSNNPLGDYVRRVMQENGLDYVRVSKMASKRGSSIGKTAVQQIVQGHTTNPGIYTVRALALGLGRPVEEVIAAALGIPALETNSYKASDFANLAELYKLLPLPEQRGYRKYWLQVMEREMRQIITRLSELE